MLRILIIVTILSLSVTVFSKEKIILDNADKVVGYESGEGETRDYDGNVIMRQGDLRLSCDFATQYLNTNNVHLKGNVIITKGKMTMKAPEIMYYGNSKFAKATKGIVIIDDNSYLEADEGTYDIDRTIANFKNNVFIEDDSVVIYSDYLTHNRKSRESLSNGNVYLIGKYENLYLLSDTIFNEPAINKFSAYGNPIVFKFDSTEVDYELFEYDTTSISSSSMYSVKTDQRVFRFFDNVEIVQKDIASESDTVYYFDKSNDIEMYGKPILWYDQTQIFGDTIFIKNKKQELEKVISLGDAFAVSLSDSLYQDRLNQISGDTIEIVFREKKINSIYSFGNTKTLYFFIDEGNGNGVDNKNTDDAEFIFEAGELVKINWLGETETKFEPEQTIAGREKTYYLPNFKWNDKIPKKKEFKERKN